MIAAAEKILDLLIGGLTASVPQTGKTGDCETEGTEPFTELLLGLFEPAQSQLPVQDQTVFSMSTENPVRKNGSSVATDSSSVEDTLPLTDVLSLIKWPLAEDGGSLKFGLVEEKPTFVMPREISYASGDSTGTSPVEMDGGNHEIQQVSMENDVLLLKVASLKDPAVRFTVTMPIEHWHKGMLKHTASGGKLQPIEIKPHDQGVWTLADFIDKLNVKEVEIVSAPAPKLSGESSAIIIPDQTLLADRNVGQKVIVDSQQLQNELEREVKDAGKHRESSGKSVSTESQAVQTVTSDFQSVLKADETQIVSRETSLNRQYAQVEKIPILESEWISLAQEDLPDAEGKVIESFGLESRDVNRGSVADRLGTQPVRFTLPNNVSGTLRPNGQSVTIRIEPQHLGPARLCLVMHDDKLRARVVVENYHAKATVEKSLDQLMQQLHKADVKVDHFEVTVNNNGARHELFGEHPQWYQRGIPTTTFLSSETDGYQEWPATGTPDNAALSYVGTEGVNLLA